MDLHAAVEAARADLAATLPQLRRHFTACSQLLYVDQRRTRPDNVADIDPRAARCGSCEHREDEHDPACQREGCRCHALTPWPSTVGWSQWTGPGKAECVYTAATKELQRANDCLGRIADVPAHWASDALVRPGPRSQPMPLQQVLYGVDLLEAAMSHVPDNPPPPDASALLEAADHVGAALKALDKAQERLREDEQRDLASRRCAVSDCHLEIHGNGLCRHHNDANRRGTRMHCLEHELEIVMDTGRPDPRLVICRRCRRRWKLSRLDHRRVSTG